MEQTFCVQCHIPVDPAWYFCPNCGKQIHEPPLSVSVGKQISVYAVCILLPPLGLWPGIKYLRQHDEKARTIGWIAIILTILSTIITFWLTIHILQQVQEGVNKQMELYQGI